jgi:hypothetical protein
MGKENPKSPILFIGTVGDIIAYVVKGKTYYRRKPTKKYYLNTEKQQLQHVQFSTSHKFAQKVMDNSNKQIWNELTTDMTGYDLFIKINYHSFNTSGTVENYENLIFSKGPLILPEKLSFANSEGGNGAITVTWQDKYNIEDARPSDWLRIIALYGEEVTIVEGITATRSHQTANFKLSSVNGSKVHLYAYFVSNSNKKATDTYYQMLQIQNP